MEGTNDFRTVGIQFFLKTAVVFPEQQKQDPEQDEKIQAR
jgi:hypothetical protein